MLSKTLLLLAVCFPIARAELKVSPDHKKRGEIILKEIVSQKWAGDWRMATLENVKRVAQKPDLSEPTGLLPAWSAIIKGPGGKKGHLMWDSTGQGQLIEFSFDDKLEIEGVITGVPALQEFPMDDGKGGLMASGCVPTAAANVMSYWISNGYPQWKGENGKTPKDLAIRLRKRLKMTLYPDTDGFSDNGMALAGAYPSHLMTALNADARAHQVPLESTIDRFSMVLQKEEMRAGRPTLLSCVVRVVQKPHLSWGHEVVGVGTARIDGVELVGVLDNFYPAKHSETIRWIRQDAFSALVVLRPKDEEENK